MSREELEYHITDTRIGCTTSVLGSLIVIMDIILLLIRQMNYQTSSLCNLAHFIFNLLVGQIFGQQKYKWTFMSCLYLFIMWNFTIHT